MKKPTAPYQEHKQELLTCPSSKTCPSVHRVGLSSANFVALNDNRRNGSAWQVVNDMETQRPSSTSPSTLLSAPVCAGSCLQLSNCRVVGSRRCGNWRTVLSLSRNAKDASRRCDGHFLNFLENTSFLFWKLSETTDSGLFRHCQSSRLSKSNRCVFDPLVDPRNTVVVASQTPIDTPPTDLCRRSCRLMVSQSMKTGSLFLTWQSFHWPKGLPRQKK